MLKKRVLATVIGFLIALLTSVIFANEYKSLDDDSNRLDNWAMLNQTADIVAPSFDRVIDAGMAAKLRASSIHESSNDVTGKRELSPLINKRRHGSTDPSVLTGEASINDPLNTSADILDEAPEAGQYPGDVETSNDAPVDEDQAYLGIVPSDPSQSETVPTEEAKASEASTSDSLASPSVSTAESVSSTTAKPTPGPATIAKPTTAPAPTALPTATPIPTATPKPTAIPTATPKPTAVPTATPLPTAVPTAVPTATPIPTAAPTAVPQAPVSHRSYAPVQAKNSQEPKNTTIINSSVPGFQIETYGNPTQADINHWIAAFRNVPEWIKPAQTIRVVIVEGNAGHLYYGGGTWGSILGFTHVDSAAIYVSGNTRQATTAVHETAHVYDFYAGYHSYQDSFQAIYAAEGNKLPNNLKQTFNQFEFFAEGAAQYIFNNAAVKSATPKLHQYLSNIKG